MHSQKKENQNGKQYSAFVGFAIRRIVVSVAAIVAVVWGLNEVLDYLDLSPPQTALVHKDEPGGEQPPAAAEPHAMDVESPATDANGTPDLSSEPASPGDRTGSPPEIADSQEISADSTGDIASDRPPQPLPVAELSDTEREEAAPGQEMPPDSASMHPAAAPEIPAGKQGMEAGSSTTATAEPSHPAQKPVSEKGDKNSARPLAQPAEPGSSVEHPETGTAPEQKEVIESHAPAAKAPAPEKLPVGAVFVEAVMRPIDEELSHRFWGWRPNDIINLTDNINQFQLGVLEVTRRTVVQLTERISRTGSTDAFNPHLENAMNWLMVKADRYWFPSPESKYKESLKELDAYKHMLLKKKASFYTRTDNLIPLLAVFEDLLGSCDENLVKSMENDGSTVSFFKADDYFYYAQGVASGMVAILEAVHHDFLPTLESRNGSELLHHAIMSCKTAAQLSPLFIMNSDLDGLFANHRANMAAPISHARFYIGQLIKTLST